MRLTALFVLATTACGPSQSTSSGGSFQQGLQPNGAIGLGGGMKARAEISAPILPDADVWQHKGGTGYPGSTADALSLVTSTTYTYEALLAACKSKYPTIVVPAPGQSLTAAQLTNNYDQVSRCAYVEYGAKPYWMPQILNDVDVCVAKLGDEWHLLTEAEVAGFSETDFMLMQTTMALPRGTDTFPRDFYFSLDVYVRGTDGSLKHGDLNPGANHVGGLPIAPTEMKDLYIGNGRPIGVRCARTVLLTP